MSRPDAPIIAPRCPQMSMDAASRRRITSNRKASIYAGFWTLLELLGSNFGGAERDRTADLLVANEALSQLSYSPPPNAHRTPLSQAQRSRNNISECTSNHPPCSTNEK